MLKRMIFTLSIMAMCCDVPSVYAFNNEIETDRGIKPVLKKKFAYSKKSLSRPRPVFAKKAPNLLWTTKWGLKKRAIFSRKAPMVQIFRKRLSVKFIAKKKIPLLSYLSYKKVARKKAFIKRAAIVVAPNRRSAPVAKLLPSKKVAQPLKVSSVVQLDNLPLAVTAPVNPVSVPPQEEAVTVNSVIAPLGSPLVEKELTPPSKGIKKKGTNLIQEKPQEMTSQDVFERLFKPFWPKLRTLRESYTKFNVYELSAQQSQSSDLNKHLEAIATLTRNIRKSIPSNLESSIPIEKEPLLSDLAVRSLIEVNNLIIAGDTFQMNQDNAKTYPVLQQTIDDLRALSANFTTRVDLLFLSIKEIKEKMTTTK